MLDAWPYTIAALTGTLPPCAVRWPQRLCRAHHSSDREPPGWPSVPPGWHPPDEPRAGAGADLLDALRMGPASTAALAQRLGQRPATTCMALARLAERGAVQRLGRGVWAAA